jgi:hypothetical protein
MIRRRAAVAVGMLALAVVVPSAGPAAADSDACTHNWSGPKICIELKGHNDWLQVTGIWKNPPAGVKKRPIYMYLNGVKQDKYVKKTYAERSGKKHDGKDLRYSWYWSSYEYDQPICVEFKGSNRQACQTPWYKG